MRTISAAQQAILDSEARSEHVRVEVKDDGGTFRDLSSYPGFDMQVMASWGENSDDPHISANVEVWREADGISISPFMEDSPLNHGFDAAAAYAPLLALNREFRISIAVLQVDATPVGGDWVVFFHGRVDWFNLANQDRVAFRGRDLSGALANAFIQEERIYGLASVAGLPVPLRVWAPNTDFALNEYVVPSEAKRTVGGSPRFYKVTTAGTTSATEPTWPTSLTVSGGGAVVFTHQAVITPGVVFSVEELMQNLLDDWAPGTTLDASSPPTPAFDLSAWKQSRKPLLEALRDLALLFGGDVRQVWDGAAFALTLIVPDRAKVVADYTFGADDYEDITSLTQDISGIRNKWQGVFSDSTNLDAANRPTRTTMVVDDPTSIATYTELWAEIAEEEASQIDTPTEMAVMLDAALADTKDPQIEQEVQLIHGFPWAELGDLYTFSANGRHYSDDQNLAPFSIQHTAQEGRIRTAIGCRGAPSCGFDRWHKKTTRTKPETIRPLIMWEAVMGATSFIAEDVVGGARLSVESTPDRNALGAEYEFHVSETPGFTPDLTTLSTVTKSNTAEIGSLTPGAQYYAKMVPLTYEKNTIVRGFPGEELAFVAGRASAGHISADVDPSKLPLNGGFDTSIDPLLPPDHWTVSGGVWGTDIELLSDGNGISGGNYLRFNANTGLSHLIYSATFPVEAGQKYRVRFWRKNISGSGTWTVNSLLLDYQKSTAGSGGFSKSVDSTDQVGTWVEESTTFTPSSTVKFIQVYVQKTLTGTNAVWAFDSVKVERYVEPQEAWQSPSFANAWVDFGGSDMTAAYFMDSQGVVHLRGSIKDGTIGLSAFTLPTGYRPSASIRFAVDSNAAYGAVLITSAGAVTPNVGSATRVSLDGITFRAD